MQKQNGVVASREQHHYY